MQRFTILLFGLFFISFTCSAISIRGTVTGFRKQNLPDVIVVLTSADNQHVLQNTQTDSEGYYQLEYSGKVDSLQIQILGFNIEKQSRMISAQSQQLNIQAVEKDIRIQEVVIHTKRIWRSRDTVNYLVSRFTQYDDQTLADVLRKLPYIQVVGNSTIHYLDEPINRFSIEEVDLPRDRFGLAANLLKPQDVFIIQVFKKRTVGKKRHAIQIAINLKMK
jgi:hypothetical protein